MKSGNDAAAIEETAFLIREHSDTPTFYPQSHLSEESFTLREFVAQSEEPNDRTNLTPTVSGTSRG